MRFKIFALFALLLLILLSLFLLVTSAFTHEILFEIQNLDWVTAKGVAGFFQAFVLVGLSFVLYLILGALVARYQLFPNSIIGNLITFHEDEQGIFSVRADPILGPVPIGDLFRNRFIRWLVLFKFFTSRRNNENKVGLMDFGRFSPWVYRPIWESLSSESVAGALMRNNGMPTITKHYRFFMVSTLEENEMTSRPKIIFVRTDDYDNFTKRFPHRPKHGRNYYRIVREVTKIVSGESDKLGLLRVTLEKILPL